MPVIARLLVTALLASLAAAATYVHGVWAGRLLDQRPTGEYCTGKPLGAPPITWRWFPLSNQCHWSDGTSTQLVPGYVNPLIFCCLAVAVVCVMLAARTARRHQAIHP